MAYIELNNVTFSYPDCSDPAIKNLSLTIDRGQFVVLFGASGSGKSTLLKMLKKEIQPHGTFLGEIIMNGKSIRDEEGLAKDIGFVFQDPENQMVANDVLHELVFGLENLGISTNEIRNRLAEMVHFFGAVSLLDQPTHQLSGGRKQQMNLASVLLMQPAILLLDEPTSQLDPVSSRELLDMLKRLNDEFGMTIIMAEHRLEEVFTLADQIVMMDKGQVLAKGEPREVLTAIWGTPNRAYVPTIPALFLGKKGEGNLPLTVKEGRNWIQNQTSLFLKTEKQQTIQSDNPVQLKSKGICFRYERKNEFILRDLDFSLKKGELYTLLGGNGSGKSTLLKVIAGLIKPERGKIWVNERLLKSYKSQELTKKIGYLPQNPKLFFLQDSVEKEIKMTISEGQLSVEMEEVDRLLKGLGILHLKTAHPYDLSGGELQKAALACLLLRKPEILLLDEPTKGLDPISKESLALLIQNLNSNGMTVLMSTHDVEFAARYATRCGMMFQGNITAEERPNKFFKGNFFYTTMTQRIFRDTKLENQHFVPVRR